jgi:light-regulated signal transduction histidine kinase (bacteriophytochrome)
LISTLTLFLCQALLLEERANIERKVELSELLVQEQSPLPKVVLGTGLLIAVLLGLAVYFAQTALQHAQQVSEINQELANEISDRKRTEEELQRQNLRSQLFAEVTLKIRQSLQIEEILQTAVTEVQRILQADRVLIFQLGSDGSGKVVKEAVVPGWPVILGQSHTDPCFQQGYVERYRQGRISAITDLEKADIQPCHVEFLQHFAVKANLVVPILLREELWGLLIAHQCASPRQWTNFELELLQHLANQMGIALNQAHSLEQEIRQRQYHFTIRTRQTKMEREELNVLVWQESLS